MSQAGAQLWLGRAPTRQLQSAETRRNAMDTRRSAFRCGNPPFVGLEGKPVRVDVPSRMIRFGHGKTRVTVAWLAGAALACALIGTCLALLRSDVLPFRDAWPSTHGTRTPVSELAPPQPASQPGGRPSFAAQPTTVGGVPVIGLPGVSGLPSTGPLAPATGSGPLGATLPGSGASPAPTQTTTGGTSGGTPKTTLPIFPATVPSVPATTTAPPVPAITTP